nr:hypothetical protein CFP56_59316 [Quercus suber]
MVVKGFVASDLYVTVEPAIVEARKGLQHTVLDGTIDEHINSLPLQSYQRCAENTSNGYGSEPWYDFKELLDTMGEHEDADHIEDVFVEENRDTCLGPDPMPEWFTKNIWDNMFASYARRSIKLEAWGATNERDGIRN